MRRYRAASAITAASVVNNDANCSGINLDPNVANLSSALNT